MIGLKIGTVELKEHNPLWVEEAHRMIDQIKEILKDSLLDAKHIGSTAIPTIKAKPIIDIAIKVSDFKGVHENIDALHRLGLVYRYHEDMPSSMYFMRRIEDDTVTTHHVFFFKEGSLEWETHISFCMYLKKHPEEAKLYENLKEKLLTMYPTDRVKYTKSKADYIQEVLDKMNGVK